METRVRGWKNVAQKLLPNECVHRAQQATETSSHRLQSIFYFQILKRVPSLAFAKDYLRFAGENVYLLSTTCSFGATEKV